MRARLATLAVAAFVVAGCSSSSSGGGNLPPTTSPIASTSSASASPSASASRSPTPTPSYSTTVSASHRCSIPALQMELGQEQGAAGSTILPIIFTNSSSKPCTLFGYPGVSFLDASNKQIGLPADERGGEEATVTLAPGDQANAQLSIPDPGNFSASDCNPAMSSYLRVYPPGEKHFVVTPESMQVCSTAAGRAVVLPVAPGNGA